MRRILLAGLVGAIGLTACAPGSRTDAPPAARPASAVPTDPAAAGNVTLTVWDQEVRGGQNDKMVRLNAEFQQRYPNVTIKRVSKSFDDLKTTLRLALSGANPPDVVQANQGYPDMGTFVRAGMLRPLDPYAEAYHWRDRFPKTLLDLNSFSADGKQFGGAQLYGVAQTGEVIGLYYNKDKLARLGALPQTWAELEQLLARAKQAGEVPIQLGNLDKYPAIHVYGVLQAQAEPKDRIRDLVFGRNGATWTDDGNLAAARTLADWVAKGYFTDGANGLGYDDAWRQFAGGTGVFLLTGTWMLADLRKAMGDKVGFIVPPARDAGGQPVTTGGQGLSFSVTAKSAHPDVAAAYLDFITNEHAADVMEQTGNLPIVVPKNAAPQGLQADIFAAWQRVSTSDGLVPYLDYTTPTSYDTITAALQALLGKQRGPNDFVTTMQRDYEKFLSTR